MSAPGTAGAESRRRDPARHGKLAIASLQGKALPSHVAKERSPAPLSQARGLSLLQMCRKWSAQRALLLARDEGHRLPPAQVKCHLMAT